MLLYGQDLKKIIKNLKINKEDLIESTAFSLERAYSAVVSSRQNDWMAVRDSFTKSALYGLQVLIYAKTKKLLFSYNQIKEESENLIGDEYRDLIDHVIEVRKGNEVVVTPLLYKNISFLNRVVLKAVKAL